MSGRNSNPEAACTYSCMQHIADRVRASFSQADALLGQGVQRRRATAEEQELRGCLLALYSGAQPL